MKASKFLFALSFLLNAFSTSAVTDSIDIYLKKINDYPPHKRVEALNAISNQFFNSDLSKALYYSEIAKDIAISINDSTGLGEAYYNIGYIKLLKGENSEANRNLTKAYSIFYINNNRNGIAKASDNLGSIYRYVEEYDKSLELHLTALKLFIELKDTNGIISSKNNIGIIYRSINSYDKSIRSYEEALHLAKVSKSKLITTVYNSIGSYFWYLEQNDSALTYYRKVLRISPSTILLKERYCAALNNMGNVFRSTANSDSAIFYYNLSLKKSQEFGFINLSSITLKNFGIVYFKNGNYLKAIDVLNQSISLARKSNLKRILSDDYSLLSEIYSKMGNHKEALKYYKYHSDIHDSIFVDEHINRINQLEVESSLQQKEKDNAILLKNIAEKNLQIQENKNLFVILGLVILFLAVVSIISLRYFKLSRESAIKLQKLNENLEQRVGMRTQRLQKEIMEHNITATELIKAKEKAEESDRLKSLFLANLSHEIRTPMNAIQGFTDLLKTPNLEEDKKEAYISIIKKSGSKLLLIINDIIEISKIEAGQIATHFSSINLKDFFSDLYNTMVVTVPDDKNIDINLVVNNPNQITHISTDEVKLLQILTNLINNAIKFTEEGSISFGYEILDEKKILFFVKDTGIGIENEYKEVIFERFRRIESDLAIKKGGSGLGLAISKAYVEMLGGSIQLESEHGKGSCFTFSLPLIKVEKSLGPTNPVDFNERNYCSDDNLILIAEDDDINYLYFKEITSSANFNIIRATNGKEAVDYCQKHDFSIVLMDIKMPEMDGFEALKLIKAKYPNLPVVAQTSYALPEDELKIKSAGFDGYITKPINKDVLIKAIEQFLNAD